MSTSGHPADRDVVHAITSTNAGPPAAPQGPALPPWSRRKPWLTAAIGLIALTGGSYFAHERTRLADSEHRALLPLVRAVGKRRFFEPRLVGGFEYGILATARRGPVDKSGGDWSLLAAAAEAKSVGGITGSSLRALAAAHLLLGEPTEAIRLLEEPPGGHTIDPYVLSDLAAAYLVRSSEEARPEDIPRALETATRALAGAPESSEALFNRGLALDALSLRQQSQDTWRHALSVTTNEEWREEIKRKLLATAPTPPAIDDARERFWSALHQRSRGMLRELIEYSVDSARAFFEEELLAGLQAGLTSANDLIFFGEVYQDVTHDPTVTQTARFLAAPKDARTWLVCSRYGEARRLYTASRWRDAEEILLSIGPTLEELQAPLLGWNELWLGVQLRQRGEMDSSRRRLGRALGLARRGGQKGLEARARYNLSVIDEVQGLWDEALREREEALALDRSTHDLAAVAHVAQQSAAIWSLLGRHRIGWERRIEALKESHRISDPNRRLLVVNLVGDDCLKAGLPRCALAFYDDALRQAFAFKDPSSIADTLLGQAVALAQVDASAAAAKLAQAHSFVEQVPDATLRARLTGESMRARAEIESSHGKPSLGTLTSAIDWLGGQNSSARAIPFRFQRARILAQAGDAPAALADLDLIVSQASHPAAVRNRDPLQWAERRYQAQALREAAVIRSSGTVTPPESLQLAEESWSGAGRTTAIAAIAALRSRIRADQGALAFLSSGDVLLSWFIADGTIAFHRTDISEAELLTMRRRATQGVDSHDDAALLRLSEVLLGPHADQLKRKHSIVVIGDLRLIDLPFLALPLGTARLVDFVDVTLAPSVAAAIAPERPRSPPIGALVVGVNTGAGRSSRLMLAEQEAKEIGGRLGNASVLLGATARKSVLLKDLRESTVFHFAGHALVDTERPENSRLILAEEDNRPLDLTAGEISQLSLHHLQLAFLAACGTSLSTFDDSEPVASLAEAFLAAGTRRVIATLYPVSDDGMKDIAARIYDALNHGTHVPAAVRQAVLATHAGSPLASDANSIVVFGPLE